MQHDFHLFAQCSISTLVQSYCETYCETSSQVACLHTEFVISHPQDLTLQLIWFGCSNNGVPLQMVLKFTIMCKTHLPPSS